MPDVCELSGNDCDANGVPDDCDADCDSDGTPDACEPDCNMNGTPDDCDISTGTSEDCQPNGVPDECDISSGSSVDFNTDGIPDECKPDCNLNGIPDYLDIVFGVSRDCQPNKIPDECEEDCNGNEIPDDCDIASGFSVDADGDGILDECFPLSTPGCFGTACPCGNDSGATGCINSTGSGALLTASGTRSISQDNLALEASGFPPLNSGIYVMGDTVNLPLAVGDGLLCTGGLFRFTPGQVSETGAFSISNVVSAAPPGLILPGDTRVFQAWTRDVLCAFPAPCPGACGGASISPNNTSNALSVTFVP